MKKFAKVSLVLALCLSMLLGSVIAAPDSTSAAGGDGSYSLDLSDYADKWEYKVKDDVGYYALDVVYCAKPVDPTVQHMAIYVPAAYMTKNADGTVVLNKDGEVINSSGVVYTAETAPIMYSNTSGGYSASSVKDVTIGYITEGYVQVSVGTRGKGTKNADGEYIGQFPVIVADLKAGVRFMKANDDVMPGNSERIISKGASSGGALSTMLGASGNSPLFDSYLEEIGAANATDDIFIALCYCPITNLSSADAAYEWYQHANTEYFLFDAMAYDREGNHMPDFPVGKTNFHDLGDNILGGAHEDELSDLLYDWFVDYVQGLGFDLGDDGRTGEFYTGVTELYSKGLTEYIARYDELKTGKQPAAAKEYLASLKNGDKWFTYDEATGEATVLGLDEMMFNFVDRKKMAPSLDSYNYKSNENDAFVAADGTTLHFSPTVRDMLKILMDEADTYGWTEEELEYITLLYGDYVAGVTDESAEMLEVMSPINYIINDDWQSTVAPYFRFRVGSNDGDHGFPAAWLTANGLWEHTDSEVDIGISWNMGHGEAELTAQDQYDYINAIMVKEDEVPVVEIKPVVPEIPAEPEVPETPSVQTYTVKSGDCLWNIAAKTYGNGAQFGKIAEANGIKNPALIYVGQKLILP